MTAPTIKEQITQPYVGELVELITIDTSPVGGTDIFRFTPSSDTPISFNGVTYNPMPITISGLSRSLDSAPGRVNLQVSSMNGLIAAAVITLGDLAGAKVTYIRTFKNYLDGQADGGLQQSFPIQRYIKTFFILSKKRIRGHFIVHWHIRSWVYSYLFFTNDVLKTNSV